MFACIYIRNCSGDTHQALLNCASEFSPRVENTSPGTVVFDLEGLERLFGSFSEIAEKVAARVRERALQANIAVAANADAAVCAARGFGGITIVARGTEAKQLGDLPLDVLAPSPEILETLHRWGIRTIGALAKLPAVAISERLGQPGVALHKLARGAGARPIVAHVDPERFIETLDLDYEIRTIEPLTFILSRMLEAICSRLRSRNRATHEIHLSLGDYDRVLNLPIPVRNARLLTRLLILDLEAHPPALAVRHVSVEAIPAKPRIVQNGLFVPLSPEPEKLELTMARLSAVVGEENVGTPELLDTHRPDAFRVLKFSCQKVEARESPSLAKEGWLRHKKNGAKPPKPAQTGWLAQVTDYEVAEQTTPAARVESRKPEPFVNIPLHPGLHSDANPRLNIRLFRPPLDATVQVRNCLPTWIAFHGVHGSIATASGPWRSSGDWWRPDTWDREEWDIEVGDALYRIYYDVHLDRWFAQGVYD